MYNPYDPDPSPAFQRDFPRNPADPRRRWTIMGVDTPEGLRWRAFNTATAALMPIRPTYDAAFADIPEGEYHNYVQ